MINIKKILVPTDFSNCAVQALSQAINLAKQYRAELHLLHVNTLFEDNPEIFDNISGLNKLNNNIEEFIREKINNLANNDSLDDLNIIKVYERGISAAPKILEYSHKNRINLIVMGTHGRRGLEHLFLGSVAEEVVRLSSCPVLTVKRIEKLKKKNKFDNILVPIDFSERDYVSIEYAKEIAKVFKSKIQLLHVVEDTIPAAYSLVGAMSIYDLIPDFTEKTKKRMVGIFDTVKGAQVSHEYHIVNGHAVSEILKFIPNNGIDIVIIGTQGLSGIEHLLHGSVAEKVVRMATCPVCTIKSHGETVFTNHYEEDQK